MIETENTVNVKFKIENEPLIRYNSESIAQLLAERTQLKVFPRKANKINKFH